MIKAFLAFLIIPTILAKTVTLSITPACPYYCHNSKDKGYVIDVLKGFFKENGISLSVSSTPYVRVINHLEKRATELGVLSNLDLRNTHDLISHNTPLGYRSTGVVTRTLDELIILDYNDLKNKKILLPKGSMATKNIVSEMFKVNKDSFFVNEVTGSNIHARLIDLIALKRGDIALDDYNVLKYYLEKSNKKQTISLAPSSLTGHNPISLVTTRNSSLNKLIDSKWPKYLKRIRKTGVLAKILKKYGVSDWDRVTSR